MVLMWSVANPLSHLLVIGDRLGESLMFTVLDLLLKACSIGIGVCLGSFSLAVALLALTGTGLCAVGIRRFLRVAGLSLSDLLPASLTMLAVSSPLVLVLAVGARFDAFWLALALGAGLLVTAWLVGGRYCLSREARW